MGDRGLQQWPEVSSTDLHQYQVLSTLSSFLCAPPKQGWGDCSTNPGEGRGGLNCCGNHGDANHDGDDGAHGDGDDDDGGRGDEDRGDDVSRRCGSRST